MIVRRCQGVRSSLMVCTRLWDSSRTDSVAASLPGSLTLMVRKIFQLVLLLHHLSGGHGNLRSKKLNEIGYRQAALLATLNPHSGLVSFNSASNSASIDILTDFRTEWTWVPDRRDLRWPIRTRYNLMTVFHPNNSSSSSEKKSPRCAKSWSPSFNHRSTRYFRAN
jgi:hypothetical protein